MKLETLLEEAKQRNLSSFALTDINNTSSILEFVRTAHEHGIKPIVGIDFRNGIQQQYIGLARNNRGFEMLNTHLSQHLHESLPIPDRAPFMEDTFIIYPYPYHVRTDLRENEFIGIQLENLNHLSLSGIKIPDEKLVLLRPVTFRNKKDFNAHRLLRAIECNTLLSMLPREEQTLPNEKFLTEEELKYLEREYPFLLQNSKCLLDQCSIEFEYNTSKNKAHCFGSRDGDFRQLQKLCEEGLKYRYPIITDEIRDRLEKELDIIYKMNFCSYFLINWEIIRFAQRKGFFYVGRGSGANSMVAYCLKITDVDPIDLDLYFERFINTSRTNPPDFDIDFSWSDRDEVIEFIFNKYSRTHTALLATYSTFQRKAVIRELGKVFGLPKVEIDRLQSGRRQPGEDQLGDLVLKYAELIKGFPSHLSIHAGGILISEKPINAYSATNMPPKGYPLTQFSMIEAEDIGLYKFDILSQRGLGKIKETISIVAENQPNEEPIDIHDIDRFKKDKKVKSLLRSGKSMGCFYVESPAMRMLLKKLEADNYLGLVAASSIIRPGVAKSGMMREYILRYRDKSRRNYIHPKMKELMAETFGVMVYQEDVIKVAHFFAGLTLAEADILRRGMSWKFKQRNEFAKVRGKFFSNCAERGYPESTTQEVWRQIESFANFAFSKGHSASYAVESYQSLFLKAHYPLEYMVGVINNGGGFYRTEFYVHEARMLGAIIEPPCVNNSRYISRIIDKTIFLGFCLMHELETEVAKSIEVERSSNGPFLSLEDFTNRLVISLEQLRILIRIGAFRFTGKTNKELLWDIHLLLNGRKSTHPRRNLFEVSAKRYSLPELQYFDHENAFDEIEILGFPLSSPFNLVKSLPEITFRAANLLEHVGERISINGYLVNTKTTGTSRGQRMYFGTFLDQDGYFFDTTHFPPVAKAYPFLGQGCYLISGIIAEEFGFPSIEVHSMEKLALASHTDHLARTPSRKTKISTVH